MNQIDASPPVDREQVVGNGLAMLLVNLTERDRTVCARALVAQAPLIALQMAEEMLVAGETLLHETECIETPEESETPEGPMTPESVAAYILDMPKEEQDEFVRALVFSRPA